MQQSQGLLRKAENLRVYLLVPISTDLRLRIDPIRSLRSMYTATLYLDVELDVSLSLKLTSLENGPGGSNGLVGVHWIFRGLGRLVRNSVLSTFCDSIPKVGSIGHGAPRKIDQALAGQPRFRIDCGHRTDAGRDRHAVLGKFIESWREKTTSFVYRRGDRRTV